MYEKPNVPLSIGGVVDDAVKLYRAAFQRAWVPALIMQGLVGVMMVYIRLKMPGFMAATGSRQPAAALIAMGPTLLVFYVLIVIASALLTNAVYAQLLATREGQDLPVGDSFRVGAGFFWPTLGLLLVLVVGAAVASAVASIPLFFFTTVGRTLLVMLYACVALYVVGRLYFAHVALLGDRAGIGGAFQATWSVTHGHWWRAAAIVGVVAIMFIVLILVLGFVAGLVAQVVRPGNVAATIAIELLQAVAQGAAYPLLYAGLIATYYDLKIRTKGTDLAARVEALGAP